MFSGVTGYVKNSPNFNTHNYNKAGLKRFVGGHVQFETIEKVKYFSAWLNVNENDVQIQDYEGKLHKIVNITGILKKEALNPTATLHVGKEIGRGSEKQIHLGNLNYWRGGEFAQLEVAITIQSIASEKNSIFGAAGNLFKYFRKPSKPKEINFEKIKEVNAEFELMLKLGEHPNLDTKRLMGVGFVLDAHVINVTPLAKGDLLVVPTAELHFPMMLDLMKQGAQGLAYMHSQGLCHNDVKPENFLLYEDAEGEYTVKLADFGHTRNENSTADKLLGTPSFAPIEKGAKITRDSDRFAFAQTCLDLFIINFADFKDNQQKGIYLGVTDYFSKILEGDLPDDFETIVNKLTEFKRNAQTLEFKPLGENFSFKAKVKRAEESRLS